MWVHIVIFMVILGAFLAGKLGRLPPWADNAEGQKLFVLVALAGNIIGMLLTFQSGGGTVYSSGYRMEKEETGVYEEKFMVSVDGKEAGTLYVQIPEKETEESGEEPETNKELSEEQQREKELQDMIVQYNQKKNDPRYYYLPDEGQTSGMAAAKRYYGKSDFRAGPDRGSSTGDCKKKGRTDCSDKTKRADADGLSGADHEIYPSGSGGFNCEKSISENCLRLWKSKRAAYEEIRTACYEMDSGISEAEAYRRFGERCGQVKYKTLSTLLIQNLQKGSRYLSDLLEKEAVEAWEGRKRKARVLGEAAATKLLGPMVLMLLVVMAVIMLPAGLSFYSGA